MAATKANQATEELRQEVESLRKELSEMVEMFKDKSGNYAEEIAGTVEEKLVAYKDKAEEGAEAVYEKGVEGLEEINNRVRKNPVASLAIAVGVGYLLSKLLNNDK